MPKALDITNEKYGKLTAIKRLPSQGGKTYWLCKCDCGKEVSVQTNHLRNGSTKSCGCGINKKSKNVIDFRRRIKIALVEAFGHECAGCGLIEHPVLYDFHHLNPKEKLFGIGGNSSTKGKQACADEAKKCVMLCSNCHRKIENGLISVDDLNIVEFDEKKYFQVLEDLIK